MTFCIVNFFMDNYHNFLILVCLVAASLSGWLFLGKQVVVSFVESAIILHCVSEQHLAKQDLYFTVVVFYDTRTSKLPK